MLFSKQRLSVRYPIIQDALRTEEGLSMQTSILSAYSLDLDYSDRVISYLTEIQHVLSKDFNDEKTEDTVSESANSVERQELTQDTAQVKLNDNPTD